jgi:hypothetical protein
VSLSFDYRFGRPAPDNLDATLAEVAQDEERDRLLDNAARHYRTGGWLYDNALEELLDAFPDVDESDVMHRAMRMEGER